MAAPKKKTPKKEAMEKAFKPLATRKDDPVYDPNYRDFRDGKLAGKKVSDALNATVIRNGDFTGTDFKGADISGMKLQGCIFKGCDFTDADITGSDLRWSVFDGCIGLEDANWDGVNASEAVIK